MGVAPTLQPALIGLIPILVTTRLGILAPTHAIVAAIRIMCIDGVVILGVAIACVRTGEPV